MDKLEKALEKAKAERKARMGEATPWTGSLSSEGVPPGQVELSEDVLEDNRILAHLNRSAQADRFRLLRTQVLQAMAKNGFRTIAITSPNYGEGKTTVSINLALSIALDVKQTVLLVDLDLRKPAVHEYLGLGPRVGLTDFLEGRADMADCLIRMPCQRMSILPSGERMTASSEVIASPQMARLAQEIRNRYQDRLVIYDMPPLLAQDDPLAFIPHVDCVLLVAQDGVTKTADIKRSLDILTPFPVVGTVLNDKYEWIWPNYAFVQFGRRILSSFLNRRKA